MTNAAVDPLPMLDRRDREYIAQVAEPQLRATIIASLSRYRRTTPLQVGDKVPPLALTRLADGHTIQLGTLIGQQPLCLIFGSYT